MEIFKKIWHWLSQDVTKDFQKSDEDYMLKNTSYNTGGYIKNAERYVAPRYYSEATSNNFLTGAMVGYVIVDSLNDSPSARDIEVPKSSNYESSYTPSSSSSYDSGSYSSSSDSGSYSSSCDSGC